MLQFYQRPSLSLTTPPISLLLERGHATTVSAVLEKQVNYILKGNQCKNPIICSSRSAKKNWKKRYVLREIRKLLGVRKNGISAIFENNYNEHASNLKDGDSWSSSMWSSIIKHLNSLYQFSRPHTVIGTIIGITSVSLLPVETILDLSPRFFMGLLKALVPSVLMNIYVVGLNQLFDVEIDKVNKPYLPLASGNFSIETGIIIVAACLLLSLAMGIMFQSPPLLAALLISFALGSVYSIELPFLRWKKHAFLAASCILIARAMVVQLAFFVHIQKFVLGKPIVICRSLVFATAFMCFFSAVIALFKDIPDVDGDRDFGIQSFSLSLGQEKVFWLCVNMLLLAYGAAVAVGTFSPSLLPIKLVTMVGHSTIAWILWRQAQSVDLNSKYSITSFYMFIWKLFYVEYFLIPFVR
ncbi:hypothetical protein P3X46_019294 [Hevea brasiliensis]|uniref:Uncharacterized protein n=1 Tax=Hevea brasiliensis TaxID=3981 RepID=A0ABQ9LL58_HEVBR|nr:homogentisate phytyltransferase 1, chloroplastic [Hevea brasiliensis]KAJ9167680.1 hypothetical protein P3X46_019294 [Hevea brasiliensis]